jgi:hypothetical protein
MFQPKVGTPSSARKRAPLNESVATGSTAKTSCCWTSERTSDALREAWALSSSWATRSISRPSTPPSSFTRSM